MRARRLPTLVLLAVVLGMNATALLAHHSFAAEYDAQVPVTVTGTVNHIEWTNPHAYVYIDVKDASGSVVTWAFEGYPPNTLKRTGFTRDFLKPGETVTITGWKARFSANRAAGREVTTSDGTKKFLGPQA